MGSAPPAATLVRKCPRARATASSEIAPSSWSSAYPHVTGHSAARIWRSSATALPPAPAAWLSGSVAIPSARASTAPSELGVVSAAPRSLRRFRAGSPPAGVQADRTVSVLLVGVPGGMSDSPSV
jgi:hypothetical protein